MDQLSNTLVLLNVYILLVLSANLTIGMVNLLTMCQAAFYGIGAYIGTFFLMHLHVPITVILVVVALATGLSSFLVSYASSKLKGNFFVLASMGFQLVVYAILGTWMSVTGGMGGIHGVPRFRILGIWELSGLFAHPILSFLFVVATVLLFYRLHHSPFGRELRAIRADELMVKSMGHNTIAAKSWAFFISAAVAGVAGVIYASSADSIDPTTFALKDSLFIISALFIGGMGNVKGPVLGAVLLVLLPELLHLIGIPKNVATDLHPILYGLALILVVFFRPQGVAGETKLI